MKRISNKAILAILLLTFGCIQKVPITGRKQVQMLPEKELIGMSLTNYKDFISKNKTLPATHEQVVLVRKVGERIKTAVQEFMKKEGLEARLTHYKWEFNVVDESTVNAWCMPGGKVVVYTGLLPVTQDEEGLAIVMGHEIAHAVARHGNERMSQGLLVTAGAIGLSIALNDKPAETKNLFLQSFGIGSTLGILKYSRTHETEADKLGLIFAAMAGYNPEKAISFWERMAANSGGGKVPEILSTHPNDQTRIADLKAFMPTAKKYYKVK